ncbi:hypothetical protein CK625_07680 [Vandammella animalimorsus]|uniref:Uncharacterized protein n=1 Tax=Vandammella animalimorsus TaxID=2029117 RepID=A0A2A2AGV1_9BURK|nr:hypothetical protein CK625_07680 [Vandammella animalimorsus]
MALNGLGQPATGVMMARAAMPCHAVRWPVPIGTKTARAATHGQRAPAIAVHAMAIVCLL